MPEWTLCANGEVYARETRAPNRGRRSVFTDLSGGLGTGSGHGLSCPGPELAVAVALLGLVGAAAEHPHAERGGEQDRAGRAGDPHRPEVRRLAAGEAHQ